MSKTNLRRSIVETLKKEMNQTEPSDGYSQWVLGVGLRKNEPKGRELISYTARTILKTNQSPFLDGMDIWRRV